MPPICVWTNEANAASSTLVTGPGGVLDFNFLDYFLTGITGGNARSHYADGSAREVSYTPRDTQHNVYGAGQFMIHDIENIGLSRLRHREVPRSR